MDSGRSQQPHRWRTAPYAYRFLFYQCDEKMHKKTAYRNRNHRCISQKKPNRRDAGTCRCFCGNRGSQWGTSPVAQAGHTIGCRDYRGSNSAFPHLLRCAFATCTETTCLWIRTTRSSSTVVHFRSDDQLKTTSACVHVNTWTTASERTSLQKGREPDIWKARGALHIELSDRNAVPLSPTSGQSHHWLGLRSRIRLYRWFLISRSEACLLGIILACLTSTTISKKIIDSTERFCLDAFTDWIASLKRLTLSRGR